MSTTSSDTTTAIEREIAIAARPETVWEFFVDPEKACRWMGLSAELDPQPGGIYRVEVIPGNVARGVFVELDPPRRLVYTWGWEAGAGSPVPPGSTTIEIDLVAGRRRHDGALHPPRPPDRRRGHASTRTAGATTSSASGRPRRRRPGRRPVAQRRDVLTPSRTRRSRVAPRASAACDAPSGAKPKRP